MPTKKFPREVMLDLLSEEECEYESEHMEVLSDVIVDTDRWSIHYELTFKQGEKIYLTNYSRGATEYQDESPWEDNKEVTCYQAEAYSVTTTAYRRVRDVKQQVQAVQRSDGSTGV